MGTTVKRAYRYRFYPTLVQERRLTFAETCRMLTQWKAEPDTAWLYEVSNVRPCR